MVALPTINLKSKSFQTKLFGFLSIALLIFIGVYSYLNVTKILDANAQIATHDKLHNTLAETSRSLDSEIENLTEKNSELLLKIQKEVEQVFPSSENHTQLTRTLEQFEYNTHKTKDPFFLNNLQYRESETPKGENYSVLPFSITMQTSRNNFYKFLEWVESSGTLDSGLRILNVPKITINFVAGASNFENTSGEPEINFSVDVLTYFRNTSQDI